MANTILITANWHTGALSQQTISRQYDNNRYAVRFVGYPEASDGNELDYYLLVWMSTAPGQKPGEITPIQLNSDQWYISNYFTQQVQVIKFQLCVLNEAGTYEAHSPIFSGRIGDSLEHNGTSQDIDVSTLFDAYREYLNELIIGAGAVIIDPTPTQGSSNAVSSGGVYAVTADLDARVEDLEQGGTGGGITEAVKTALLQIAQKIVYVDDDGQNYYNALYNALYPPVGLVSISAVYTQSKAVYQTTALDTIKDDLIVTAHYTDSTTETITNYTLSGTLTAGTSIITVSYGDKTTTIIVTVTSGVMPLYQWDLTQSLVDEIDGITAVTTGTQGSSGLVINANASGEYCDFGAVYSRDQTYELDVVQIERTTALNARTIMFDVDEVTQQRGSGLINCRSSSGSRYGWYFYLGSAWDANALISGTPEDVGIDAFNGKTIKLYLDENGIAHVYSKTIGADDSEYVSIGTSGALNDYTNGHVYIGSTDSSDALKNAIFSGFRIYAGEK